MSTYGPEWKLNQREQTHKHVCTKNNGTITVRYQGVGAFTEWLFLFCSMAFQLPKNMLLERNISNIWLIFLSVINCSFKNNNMLSFLPTQCSYSKPLTHHNQSERETTGLRCPHSTSYTQRANYMQAKVDMDGQTNLSALHLVLILHFISSKWPSVTLFRLYRHWPIGSHNKLSLKKPIPTKQK